MTKLSFYLPVDHHVEYHKIFGILLFLLSAVHTVSHLYNIEKNFKEGNYELYLIANNLTITAMKNLSFAEWLLTDQPKGQLISKCPFVVTKLMKKPRISTLAS